MVPTGEPLRWVERLGPAMLAGTGRSGGVSEAPYASLNLGDHVGDDPGSVAQNRDRVARAAGVAALVFAQQVHGRQVAEVAGPWKGPAPEADAMVTGTPGLALGILVADCTPVLLASVSGRPLVGAAHAGRRGLQLDVVGALVEVMRRGGAERLTARVGPSICARCYEVPLAMREEVASGEPAARSVTRSGTPALDIAAGVIARLAALEVEVEERPGCTMESTELFSYRRDPTTGRQASLVWLAA